MPHDRMLATRDTYTWIQKYIFPGGLLPSVEAIERAAWRAHRAADRPSATASAALRRDAAAAGGSGSTRGPTRSRALGFDETFRRMWTFYLAYSEAGFRAGYLDVSQLVLARSVTADDAPRRASPRSAGRPARRRAGGELPVRLRAWDGSEAGPAGRPGAAYQLAAGAAPAAVAARRARPGPGLRHRRARRRGRPGRRPAPRCGGTRPAAAPGPRSARVKRGRPRRCSRARLGLLGPRPADPAVAGAAQSGGRRTAGRATGPRSPTTTTCRTSSTR